VEANCANLRGLCRGRAEQLLARDRKNPMEVGGGAGISPSPNARYIDWLCSGFPQFRAVEVPPLEKREGEFKGTRLVAIKLKLTSAIRRWARRLHLRSFRTHLVKRGQDNPGPARWAGHACAHNAIGHEQIIESAEMWTGVRLASRIPCARSL
jgi:hypothetical protein